jgi:hypothetical protein
VGGGGQAREKVGAVVLGPVEPAGFVGQGKGKVDEIKLCGRLSIGSQSTRLERTLEKSTDSGGKEEPVQSV